MKPSETKGAWVRSALTLRSLLVLAVSACGSSTAPSPFVVDAGPDGSSTSGGGNDGGLSEDGGPIDDTLGDPCNDDSQCDDEISCTIDTCDKTIDRCRHNPDDASCQNGVFCDGVERCDTKLGCRLGVPVACSDGDVCTIDTCLEAMSGCGHAPRDADFDGAPDGHCIANGDCDDQDPSVGPDVPEVCQNQRDDDCDGQVDEADCAAPKHDGCLDPFVIDAPGTYQTNTTAAALNFSATCGVANPAGARDIVAAVIVPAGPPVDVEIAAKSNADIAIALLGQCGDASTEIACSASYFALDDGRFAKIRARNIGNPANPTPLPLYVFTDAGAPVILDVSFSTPTPAPTNETCGTAISIPFDTPVIADVVDVDKDVGTACNALTGDLIYSFDLAAPSNVHIYANSIDGDAEPVVSLRNAACALPEDEITCQEAESVHIFRHELPAGQYHLAVSATAPTVVSTTVVIEAPTSPLPDETCVGSPVLDPNKTIDVSFQNRQDDIDVGCLSSAVDVAYRLDLPTASDVLLVQRISSGDDAAISLDKPTCADPMDALVCGTGSQSPIRTNKRNVPAGEYRVVSESLLGLPTQITAFVRKTTPALIVPFADACADVLAIPATGGFFRGNTANATASFQAGCDQAGGPPNGARDQLLKITLPTQKRVVLDMAGSAYSTLLDVRRGPDCPGTEVFQGCTVGYGNNKSFLDLTLDAGVYFIQIDGYNKDDGPWFLDVRVVDPL
jgi:Putative metal-binding motif